MKKFLIAALLIILGSLPAEAATTEMPPVNKRGVMNAIAVFRNAPTSQMGSVAEAMIFKFADSSQDAEVHISSDFVPWFSAKPEPRHAKELVIAYLAGTLRSQLEHSTRKNDALAGLEQVIETYQQIRKAEPGFRDNFAEKFSTMKANGKLKDYVKAHDKT